jgi:fructose-1,6-bisphosphatase II
MPSKTGPGEKYRLRTKAYKVINDILYLRLATDPEDLLYKEWSPSAPLASLLDATEGAALWRASTLGSAGPGSVSPAGGWPLRELLARARGRESTAAAAPPGDQLLQTMESDQVHLGTARQPLIDTNGDTVAHGVLAAIAVGPGTEFDLSAGSPCMLIIASSEAGGEIDFKRPLAENIRRMAASKGGRISQVTIGVPDEDSNRSLVGEIVKAGASVRLFQGARLAGMLACCREDRGIDAWIGEAEPAEARIVAGGLRLLGGVMYARAQAAEYYRGEGRSPFGGGMEAIQTIDDLDPGPLFRFVATGISESPLLPGVLQEPDTISTWSLALDASARTVAWIRSDHPGCPT